MARLNARWGNFDQRGQTWDRFWQDASAAATAPVTATPGVASLTITAFAPTVQTPRLVTVGTASLTTETFAPTATGGSGGAATATPGTASLALAPYAPTVSARDEEVLPDLRVAGHHGPIRRPVTVSPSFAHIRVTGYPPTVRIDDDDLALILAA